MRMLAPTTNLDNAGVLCILAVLAAVFAVSLGGALAHTVRALLVLSHVNYPLFRITLMVGLENRMVKRIGGKQDSDHRLRERWPLKQLGVQSHS